MNFRVQILGSGTSMGVPMAGCTCETCTSADPRDKRLRTSALVTADDKQVLIDTSVDYRQQMLRAGVRHLDAVVYTHHHVDHILGMDDLRSFMLLNKTDMPLFAMEETAENIKRVFSYAFQTTTYGSLPRLKMNVIDETPFEAAGIPFTPIPLFHGKMPVMGYRIGNFAYCTDVSFIPEPSFDLLRELDVLILDALRYRTHPTHFNIEQAIEAAQRIGAKETYFTHISHDIKHSVAEKELPASVYLAYDGIEFEFS